MTKSCIGCGEDFEYNPARPNKTRCKPKCGVTRVSKKGEIRPPVEKRYKFIAVDGEGENRDVVRSVEQWDEEVQDMVSVSVIDSVHEYVLLTVGDRACHKGGKILTYKTIFPFLWDCFKDDMTAAYVGFFLGYDFTMWLKGIDPGAAWRLLTSQGQQRRKRRNGFGFRPVVIDNEWELDIVWPKIFKIRPHYEYGAVPMRTVIPTNGNPPYEKEIERPWMTITDTGPFFQTSFLKAVAPEDWPLDPICSDEEYKQLKIGKAGRGGTLVFSEAMLAYNAKENEILPRLLQRLDDGFREDGINLTKGMWFGPGQAASEWFKKIGAPNGEMFREVTPVWVREAARASYYGGWFEIFAHGIVKGNSYGYDINSAYPDIIRKLPCLLHGSWSRGSSNPPVNDNLQLWKIKYEGEDRYVGPFPVRDKEGAVLRPLDGIGWYWRDEIEASISARLVSRDAIEVLEWVNYDPCSCPPPLKAVEDLYFGRLRADRNGKSPAGKAKKLVYNSGYGKTCQSVGSAVWANVVYASLITSGCRSKIVRAIGTHPRGSKDLLMVATDGVYFASKHPILERSATNEKIVNGFPMRKHLGEWEAEPKRNLALYMPGIYWDDKAREKIEVIRKMLEEYKGKEGEMPDLPDVKLRSRGISSGDLAVYVPEVERQWKEGILFPEVTVPLKFCITGAKLAAHRRDWDTCGKLMHNQEKKLSARSNDTKRMLFTDRTDTINGAIRSYPWDQSSSGLTSYPYDKSFGDDYADVTKEIPTEKEVLNAMIDTEEDHLTQEGPLGMLEGQFLQGE